MPKITLPLLLFILLAPSLEGQSRWYLFSGLNTSFSPRKNEVGSFQYLSKNPFTNEILAEITEKYSITNKSILKLGGQFGVGFEKKLFKNAHFVFDPTLIYSSSKISSIKIFWCDPEKLNSQIVKAWETHSTLFFQVIHGFVPFQIRFRPKSASPWLFDLGFYASFTIKNFSQYQEIYTSFQTFQVDKYYADNPSYSFVLNYDKDFEKYFGLTGGIGYKLAENISFLTKFRWGRSLDIDGLGYYHHIEMSCLYFFRRADD